MTPQPRWVKPSSALQPLCAAQRTAKRTVQGSLELHRARPALCVWRERRCGMRMFLKHACRAAIACASRWPDCRSGPLSRLTRGKKNHALGFHERCRMWHSRRQRCALDGAIDRETKQRHRCVRWNIPNLKSGKDCRTIDLR